MDEKTQNKGYPLPHKSHKLRADVERLREALNAIDADIDALNKATPDGATTASPGIVRLATLREVGSLYGSGVITATDLGIAMPTQATEMSLGLVKLAEIPTDDINLIYHPEVES